MSPYHVLIEKNCYPHGCVYFSWKCKLLAKQKKCFRGFEIVGKKCFNCKYFYEEKIHQYPLSLGSEEKYSEFQEEFDDFLDWIGTLLRKRVLCEGRVNSIKPDLKIDSSNNRIVLKGFLIRFSSGFLDNKIFDDSFYLRISPMTQNKLQIRNDDNIEFEANLKLDRGRLIFLKSGRFHFIERGGNKAPGKTELLVALNTATILKCQPEKCMNCTKGVLSDIDASKNGPRRALVCLMGFSDYQLCTYIDNVSEENFDDICANPGWKDIKCKYTL